MPSIMKNLLSVVLILLTHTIAQAESIRNTDITICEVISHAGFAIVDEKTFNEAFSYLKDSSFTQLSFTVNVSGMIDSVYEKYDRVHDMNNTTTSVPITGIVDHKVTTVKAVKLKNSKLTLPKGNDSTMVRRFKSDLVFIPSKISVTPGDIIDIKNYGALLNDTCYVGETTQQKALVYGEYSLSSTPSSLPANSHKKTAKVILHHNRDAQGKFSKNDSKYSVKF